MKKKLKLWYLLIISLLVLTSCGKPEGYKEKDQQKTIGHSSVMDSDVIKTKIGDFVQIDAQVDIPDALQNLKMKKVKAHRPKLDLKVLKGIFFDRMKIEREEVEKGFKSREFGKYAIQALSAPEHKSP